MNNLLGGIDFGALGVGGVRERIDHVLQPKPEVEFKAGKLNYDGKMVKPDRRRGIIRVVMDQGLKQFQWLDASSKTVIEVT